MPTEEIPEEDLTFAQWLEKIPVGADWELRKRRSNGGSPMFTFTLYQYIGEGGINVQGTGDSPADAVKECLKNYLKRWTV